MNTMMKTMLGALTAACLALLLGACGGGSGGQTAADDAMTIGVEYALGDTDRVVSTGATPAVIEIRHDLATGQRYVTLLEGSADLLHGV
ncbi:MAG: hypothetical protein ACLGH6_05085 [Gammaproteobacteria bacterium]